MSSRLVFMLEEPSIKALLDNLLPRFFPGLELLCIPHDGKSDLERSLPRKLRAWMHPNDRFVVIRDNDGGDCKALKVDLAAVCSSAGRPDTLIRIACQELEAWYFGEPNAMADAFESEILRSLSGRARYRNPDKITKPAQALSVLCPGFQKVSGARRMAEHLSYNGNNSLSFRIFIEGIARISSRSLPP